MRRGSLLARSPLNAAQGEKRSSELEWVGEALVLGEGKPQGCLGCLEVARSRCQEPPAASSGGQRPRAIERLTPLLQPPDEHSGAF